MKPAILLLFFCLVHVLAVAQQTQSAGAGANSGAGTTWSTPGNIVSSNNAYATITNGTSQNLVASNFGFSIPTNSTINGIAVRIERRGVSSNNIAQGTWQRVQAPAFVSGTTTTATYNTTTYTGATVGTGSNRVLIVVVAIETVDNTVTYDINLDPVNVTYNGTAMTRLNTATNASSTTRNWIGVFYLKESQLPAGGTSASLVVTKTRGATAAVEDNDEYVEHVAYNTFSNVEQTFTIASVARTEGASNTATATSSHAVQQGDMLINVATSNTPTVTYTPQAGFTEQIDYGYSNGGTTTGASFTVATRSITATGVAPVTPTTTASASGRLNLIGVVLYSARVFDNVVQLVKGGSAAGSNLSNGSSAINLSWPDTDQTTTYGGSTNLWGTTWTAAEINASNFGIALSANATNAVASIDHIEIIVYYTELLPLHLLDFTASADEHVVNAHFEVAFTDPNRYTVQLERSQDGRIFSFVNKTDFTEQAGVYVGQLLDANPYSGVSYYRLQLTDHAAQQVSYSRVQAVSMAVLSEAYALYPNPAVQGVFFVHAPQEMQSIKLYDVAGKLLPADVHLASPQTYSVVLRTEYQGLVLVELTCEGFRMMRRVIVE